MPGFRRLRAAPKVLAYLGAAPEDLQRVLVRAIEEIREKKLRMIPAGRPGLFLAFAADHTFIASLGPDRDTVVIIDLVYDPEGDIL
jgi:hypothetical protein